ncbi:MAG: hypothetical protein ACLVCW_05635 [Campylobacter sp.]
MKFYHDGISPRYKFKNSAAIKFHLLGILHIAKFTANSASLNFCGVNPRWL